MCSLSIFLLTYLSPTNSLNKHLFILKFLNLTDVLTVEYWHCRLKLNLLWKDIMEKELDSFTMLMSHRVPC